MRREEAERNKEEKGKGKGRNGEHFTLNIKVTKEE